MPNIPGNKTTPNKPNKEVFDVGVGRGEGAVGLSGVAEGMAHIRRGDAVPLGGSMKQTTEPDHRY